MTQQPGDSGVTRPDPHDSKTGDEAMTARRGRGSEAGTTPYHDRPTDDGMHGDGAADPSGVAEEARTT